MLSVDEFRRADYLLAIVMGRWFYLYLILDLYSRKGRGLGGARAR